MVDLLTDGYDVKYGARSIHHEVGVYMCIVVIWCQRSMVIVSPSSV